MPFPTSPARAHTRASRELRSQPVVLMLYFPSQAMPTDQQMNGGGTILVIDDDVEVLDSVQRLLESEGVAVLTAPGPIEGIKMYTEHWPRVKVVILDFFMHIMKGDEVFEQLQRVNPAVHVVLATGCDDEITERMIAKGVRSSLQKPFNAGELLSRVRDETTAPLTRA